jgi:hypothetical protein
MEAVNCKQTNKQTKKQTNKQQTNKQNWRITTIYDSVHMCIYASKSTFSRNNGRSLEITPYQQLLEYMCATSTIWFIKHGVSWTMYVLFERFLCPLSWWFVDPKFVEVVAIQSIRRCFLYDIGRSFIRMNLRGFEHVLSCLVQ